jgi:Spy/CpxP family protein refolding chaperone
MLPDYRVSWQNPKVLTVLLLVFLCGATVGALAMRAGLHDAMHKSSGPYWKDGGKDVILERFKKELSLTPEQTKQMETVLDDFMTYLQTLQSQMDEVRANGKDRIVRILNEEQRKKFDQMVNDLQAKQVR